MKILSFPINSNLNRVSLILPKENKKSFGALIAIIFK